MKTKGTLLILTILIGFNSYSQDKFFNTTCNCINQITESSNQSIIAEQIQNCFQKSIQSHNSEIGIILQNYVEENPKTDMKFAEQNLSKILTEKVAEKCPKFNKINNKLNEQQQNSDNILNIVADEICAELQNKTNLTDKIVDPIIIETSEKHQVSIYGQYNLDERTEMKRFATNLNAVLMNNCIKYKMYVDKKNSGK